MVLKKGVELDRYKWNLPLAECIWEIYTITQTSAFGLGFCLVYISHIHSSSGYIPYIYIQHKKTNIYVDGVVVCGCGLFMLILLTIGHIDNDRFSIGAVVACVYCKVRTCSIFKI